MAERIPSVEELGVKEWFPEEDKTPTGMKVHRHQLAGPDGRRQAIEVQRQERLGFNGLLFIAFSAPIYFAKFFGAPMAYYHRPVFSLARTAAQAFACISGSRPLCMASGLFGELLFSLVPAYLLLRDRDRHAAACVFIMCAGLSVQYAGHNDPYFTSQSTVAFGHALAVIFLFASTFGILKLLIGMKSAGLEEFLFLGASAAILYFILAGAAPIEPAVAAFLAVPFLLKRLRKPTQNG